MKIISDTIRNINYKLVPILVLNYMCLSYNLLNVMIYIKYDIHINMHIYIYI